MYELIFLVHSCAINPMGPRICRANQMVVTVIETDEWQLPCSRQILKGQILMCFRQLCCCVACSFKATLPPLLWSCDCTLAPPDFLLSFLAQLRQAFSSDLASLSLSALLQESTAPLAHSCDPFPRRGRVTSPTQDL